MKHLFLTTAILLNGAFAAGQAQTPSYKITNKVTLGSRQR